MRKIDAFRTADGLVFITQEKAEAHAANVYAKALRAVTAKVLERPRASELESYITTHLEDFEALIPLRDDCHLQNGEDDHDNS